MTCSAVGGPDVDRILRALGVVVLVCVSVIVLAPLLLQVLPAVLVIALFVWIISRFFGGPTYRGRDRYL